MRKRDLSSLSDEALADCFGRIDAERATLDALRSALRDEILRRNAKSFAGRSFVVSVASSPSSRWNSMALVQELGANAEFYRYTFSTTYVRARSRGSVYGRENRLDGLADLRNEIALAGRI